MCVLRFSFKGILNGKGSNQVQGKTGPPSRALVQWIRLVSLEWFKCDFPQERSSIWALT